MEDVFTRFVENLIGRVNGPMNLRLIMQPLMALIFAARSGYRDAKAGRPPYLWTIFTSRSDRRALLAEGWKDVGKVFLVATALDAVYQIVTVRWFYPLETLVVAVILAFIPYLLLRGVFTRLARLMG